ncbi:MAG: hypothetical protein DRP71_11430 [Verrucomicrobia bacterium]|nr:MAG: hypothetical protein DRP71_11430 [Verrucomicrobiota bacterium]
MPNCIYAVIGCFLALTNIHGKPGSQDAFVLEIDASNPKGGLMEVFFDVGRDYSHLDWTTFELPPSGELKTYRFELAARPIKRIRIDPAQSETLMRIGQVRLLTPAGETLAYWGPHDLTIMNQIDSIQIVDGVAVITIPADSNDPMIFLRGSPGEATTRWLGYRLVGKAEIVAIAILLVSAISISWWGAFTALVQSPNGNSRKGVGLAAASTFLFVFGCRLALLDQFSSPIPYWDEWDSDLHFLILPFQDGYLHWSALFEQQNEHRILLTRIIAIFGFILNGEYDPRIGMLAGAFMWSAGIALISAAAFSLLPRKWYIALIPFWIVTALPFDFANLTWGGQSQMYALGLMATCVLALAATAYPTRLQFIAAACASIASLFTMGSGYVAPLIAAGVVMVRTIETRICWKIRLLYGSVFTVTGIYGLLIYENSPRHAPTYAETTVEFWRAFQGFASWPLSTGYGTFLVIWTPWLLLATVLFFWKDQSRRATVGWLAFGLGCWALVHMVGLAYSRPDLSDPPAGRYLTTLFTPISTIVCAVVYLFQRKIRMLIKITTLIFVAIVSIAVGKVGLHGFEGARRHMGRQSIHADIIGQYLRTGDRQLLASLPLYTTPYWSSNELATRLESPALVNALPFELRQHAKNRFSDQSLRSDSPGVLTQIAEAIMNIGVVLAGFAVVLFFTVVFLPIQKFNEHVSRGGQRSKRL